MLAAPGSSGILVTKAWYREYCPLETIPEFLEWVESNKT
jgi:hypothetical protein